MITITCKTSRFNLSEVKDYFINDCCFGEDFSEWLTQEINKNGACADIVCMEDFGWFNAVELDSHYYSLAVSGYSEEYSDNPNYGSWFLTLDKKRTIMEKLLGKNKHSKDEPIFEIIISILNKAGFDAVEIEKA